MKKIFLLFAVVLGLSFVGGRVQAQCDDGGAMCPITVQLVDDYGDAWEGGPLEFYQGGVLRGAVSLASVDAGYGEFDILVCNGEEVTVVWNGSDYYYENGFTVYNGDGSLVITSYGYNYTDGQTVITFTPVCPNCSKPAALVVQELTSSSVTIAWTETGAATVWRYGIAQSGMPVATWFTATTMVAEIGELDANTVYDFYVRAVCSDEDSSATASVTFRTDCGLQPLPISEGFEDNGNSIPLCWNMLEQQTFETSWGYAYFYPSIYYYGHNGDNSLALQSYNGPVSVMSPKMPVPANEVEVLLWMSGGDYVQVGYITTNNPSTAEFHLVGTVGPTEGNEYNQVWEQFIVPFDTVTTTEDIWVVIRRPMVTDESPVYVDDILIRQYVNCPIPSNLAVAGEPTTGEVSLAWTDAEGSEWEVAYGTFGFNPDTVTENIVGTTEPFVTIGELADGVKYQFYVRAVCGELHGYWCEPIAAIPNNIVMTLATDTITSCGVSLSSSGVGPSYEDPLIENVYVIYPTDEDLAVALSGTLDMYNPYYDNYANFVRIYEGVGTEGHLMGEFTGTQNIDVVSSVGPITVWFSYEYEYSYDQSYDGLNLVVSCVERSGCVDAYDLQVESVTGSSATVSWQYLDGVECDGFQLTVTDDEENELVFDADAEQRSFTITGLNERTAYTVLLQSNCGGALGNGISASFVTNCFVGGDIQIGMNSSSNDIVPMHPYYSYSSTQQIFLRSEMGDVDQIFGVKFYVTNDVTCTRNIDVYMDTTGISAYGSGVGYQLQSTANRRFQGEVTFHQGWNEISFDNAYNIPAGETNLLLSVLDNTGEWISTYPEFGVSASNNMMTLYQYRDGGSYNPTDSSDYDGYSSLGVRNCVVFLTPCGDASCMPPLITVGEVTSNSVALSWTPGGEETAWRVEYRHSDSAEWTVAAESVTATNYSLTGLAVASDYAIRVSAICDADHITPATVSVTTLCGAFPLPLSVDFSNFTAASSSSAIQRCWYRSSTYPYNYYYPCITDYEGYDDSYSMIFYNYESTLVLPMFEGPMDTLVVSLYATGTSYSTENPVFEYGVMPVQNDTTNLIPVGTIEVDNQAGWTHFEFDLGNYQGPDGHLYFRLIQGYTVYLDNLNISAMPSCRNLHNPVVDNVTSGSVEFSFTDLQNVGNYTVYWSPRDNMGAVDSMQITTTTFTLTTLLPDSAYYVWVHANCSPTDHSADLYFGTVTMCSPYAVTPTDSYVEEFEDNELDCAWQSPDNHNVLWRSTNMSGAISGSNVAMAYSAENAVTSLVLPIFDFSALDIDAELSFYHYQFASADHPSHFSVYCRPSTTAEWTLAAQFADSLGNWVKESVVLPASAGVVGYQVYIRVDLNGNNSGVYMDDVNVHKSLSCSRPANLVVRNVNDRTATVVWTGNAPAYKVQYRPESSWSWSTRVVEANDTVVITPLNMATNYEVRVCGMCTASELTDYVYSSFTTDFCDDRFEPVNYSASQTQTVSSTVLNPPAYYSYAEVLVPASALENVTNINGLVFYADSIYGGTSLGDVTVYLGHTTDAVASSFHYDDNFVQVYSGSLNFTQTGWRSVLFQTPFEWDGESNVVVGFYSRNNDYYMSDSAYLRAHTATNNMVATAARSMLFTPSQANTLPASARKFSAKVPDLKLISCAPVCYEPVLSNVTTTSSTITMTWVNENAACEVAIKSADEDIWNLPIAVADANSYVFTELDAMTTYDVRVRRNCTDDGSDYSDWVEHTATTDTACSIPTALTFVSTDGASATFNWTPGEVESYWEIRVWNDSYDHVFTATTHPATVSGLPLGGTYQAAVRARCGSAGHVFGEWGEPVGFNNICEPVGSLTANVSGTSVTLNWNAGSNNASWLVSYGYVGFDLNQQIGYQVVTAPTVTFSDLPWGHIYAFRVRALCADEWNSPWSTDDVRANLGGVSIDGVENATVSLYPNPATDVATVCLTGVEGEVTMTIVSVEGRTVHTEHFSCGSDCVKTTDVSGLATGTYFVRLQAAEWSSVQKLVVR